MEAHLFAAGPLQDCLQPLSNCGRISGRVLADRRGEHPFGGHGFFVLFENVQNRRGKNDAPVGGFGLGRRDHQLSLDPMDLALYPKLPGAEVEVAPLEGADLAPAQAGGELQQKQFKATVLFGLDQQTLDLLRGQHLHLPGFGGWEAAATCGIAENELFGDCLVQRRVERGVDAPDGLVGKVLAVELSPEEPAALL